MRGGAEYDVFDGSLSQVLAMPQRPVSMETGVTEKIRANLLTAEADLIAEYRRRNDPYIYQSVHPADEDSFVAKGWEVHRRGKSRIRLRQKKSHDALLEDSVWALLRRMRYPQLSGKHFRIEYSRPDGSPDSKQIDVLAKDDETLLIVECKSRNTRGRKSLTKDLIETRYLQKPIADTIRRIYGRDTRLQIVWLYVTNNIIWSEPDLERADSFNINVVTENEIRYYDKFIRHLGPAGRYQFLAEFLQNKKIPELENVKVPAVRGRLGKHIFYSFVIPAKHLLKIAFINHHALNNPDGIPAYQRMVSPGRIKEIEGFIQNGGYFPTNILVNFVNGCTFDLLPNKENVSEDLKFGWLHLPSKYKSAWIIDGQHRLYGYSRLEERFLRQNLFVLAFERLDTAVEADLFITINNKQKSVPRTILASLKADLKWGSSDPRERLEALASALVKAMNSDPSSPLYQRFSMEGLEDAEGSALTIGEVSKGIARSGLLGKVLQKNYALGPLSGPTDEDTITRARKFLNIYFSQLRDANPDRWELGRAGAILSNPGIRAHLLLIAEMFRHAASKRGMDPELCSDSELTDAVAALLPPVLKFLREAPEHELQKRFYRKFGEGGVHEYFNHLCRLIYEHNKEFGSEEFRKWLAEGDEKRVSEANQDIIALNGLLNDYVFSVLKRVYGEDEIKSSGEKAYWELGVESSKTKEEAYRRQQDDPRESRRPREAYVDTIELKNIVRQRNNWEHFRDTMNIPLPGERGKTYYLDWMDRFNRLRRIPAHSSPKNSPGRVRALAGAT
jgi:DNA sulfur modification protein DndB